jgi:hypothetical protein
MSAPVASIMLTINSDVPAALSIRSGVLCELVRVHPVRHE